MVRSSVILAWLGCSSPTSEPSGPPPAPTGDTRSAGDTGDCGSFWYRDGDGDGFGDEGSASCVPEPGWVAQGGDCDDADPDLTGPLGSVRWSEVSASAGLGEAPAPWDGSWVCWREMLAGGAAVADLDGDRDPDLFLPGTHVPDQLWLNDGAGRFSRAPFPGPPGGSNGALAVDVEGDGDLDLVVGSVGDHPDRLWINDGAAGFREEGEARGLHALPEEGCRDHFGVSAADVDGDGDLDLLLAGWEEEAAVGTRPRSRLLRNDGAGRFEDATEASGLDASWHLAALDPIFTDLDGDLDPDLVLVSDWNGTTRFLNQGGRFTEAPLPEVFTDENGMGADLGDADGDGDLDLFVTSVWSEPYTGCPSHRAATCDGNRLYLAEGETFVDGTDRAGVREGQWGWGTAFLDFDLDGELDLALTGGMDAVQFREEPGRLFRGLGGGRHEDVTCRAGWLDRGQGRGVIPFDADGDGALELLVTGRRERPSLWAVTGAQGAWIQVELRQPGANPFGVGATLRVTDSSGRTRIGAIHANASYVSSRGPWLHLGLGRADGPVTVEVTWPDGVTSRHPGVRPGRVLLER